MSHFWRELFHTLGTTLKTSNSYHLETNGGQTKILNRSLETYFQCFCSEQPKQWSRWPPWIEFSYNTSFHSAIGMSPFKAVYGRPPPSLKQVLPREVRVLTVEEKLRLCDKMLQLLKRNLTLAQQRMKAIADKHRREMQFQTGDMVFVELQLYRQSSVQG